jgi:hypothetical protein
MMRTLIMAAAAAFALSAIATAGHAAPRAPHQIAAGAAAIVPVAGGCGPGFHRRSWRGRYGRWHVECVPNRRAFGYRACPPGMILRSWRGPYGHWHRRCVPM